MRSLRSPPLDSPTPSQQDPNDRDLHRACKWTVRLQRFTGLLASTDFPILSLNRWVSHWFQAVLNLFIEFFSVALAAWGFTVISFHNWARIPVSPTRSSIHGTSRCRGEGRPQGILHPFCTGTDFQRALISATKYFTQTHIKGFTTATFQERISPDFNRRIDATVQHHFNFFCTTTTRLQFANKLFLRLA